MAGFFRRLLGGEPPPPPFEPRLHVSDFLRALPHCTQFIVIASDRYSEKYNCEVSIQARDLVAFANRQAESVFGGSREAQVARLTLPNWLAMAHIHDGKMSYLPLSFVNIVDGYVLDFINSGAATVRCNQCGRDAGNIKSRNDQAYSTPISAQWTSTWKCDRGHVMYSEQHEMRIVRRPQD